MELYTNPPPEATVVCVDELGPLSPRAFPPAPAWSPDGHRSKAPLQYSRGPEKVWVFGALRVADTVLLALSEAGTSQSAQGLYQRQPPPPSARRRRVGCALQLAQGDPEQVRAVLEQIIEH